jgi:hypothetical protein
VWEDSLLKGKHFGDIENGFSRHDGSIPLMCSFGASKDVSARPLVHHQDEPARLSLGVVASQQSLLPFHLDVDCTAQAISSLGKSLLPSYGVWLLKIP